MAATRQHLEFAPPPTPGLVRGVLLAIAAHVVLVAVMAIGVAWKRESPPVTVEAELWSSVPQEAAPPAPEVETVVEPPLPPANAKAEERPAPTVDSPSNAEIALAKEKAAKKEKEELKQEQARLALEKQQRDKQAQDKALKEKQAKEKLQKEKDAKAAKDKAELAAKSKDSAAAKIKAAKEAKAEAQKLEELRQQNLARMAGLAGGAVGNGASNSTGTAAQSSGPSAGYIGRIQAAIKRNVTYIETIVGNPTTEIEVRLSPDGTILSRRIVKASGTKSWDEAALNAIDKTAVLPRDENGRVPSPMILVLSPQILIGR